MDQMNEKTGRGEDAHLSLAKSFQPTIMMSVVQIWPLMLAGTKSETRLDVRTLTLLVSLQTDSSPSDDEEILLLTFKQTIITIN